MARLLLNGNYPSLTTNSDLRFVTEWRDYDPDAIMPKEEVYAAFKEYCRKHEIIAVDRRVFSKQLFNAQPLIKSKRPTIDGEQTYCYVGLKLTMGDLDDLIDQSSSILQTSVGNNIKGKLHSIKEPRSSSSKELLEYAEEVERE